MESTFELGKICIVARLLFTKLQNSLQCRALMKVAVYMYPRTIHRQRDVTYLVHACPCPFLSDSGESGGRHDPLGSLHHETFQLRSIPFPDLARTASHELFPNVVRICRTRVGIGRTGGVRTTAAVRILRVYREGREGQRQWDS